MTNCPNCRKEYVRGRQIQMSLQKHRMRKIRKLCGIKEMEHKDVDPSEIIKLIEGKED